MASTSYSAAGAASSPPSSTKHQESALAGAMSSLDAELPQPESRGLRTSAKRFSSRSVLPHASEPGAMTDDFGREPTTAVVNHRGVSRDCFR